MFFPIAGIEIAWYIPPLAAATLSFFTSMSGISGAFLLLPFQVEVLGYTAPSVSATNQFYNLIAIPSGVYRYYKEKRFLTPLAKILIYGSIPGVILGAITRSFFFTNPTLFKQYAACILLYLAYRMGKDYFTKDVSRTAPKNPLSLKIESDTKDECVFSFDDKSYTFKKKSIFILALIIAYIGGIYGIGGGAIIAPFLFSYYKLPVYVTSGATLFCTFISSVFGVLVFYTLGFIFPEKALMPDFILGTLFGIGGLIGMSLGARAQKYLPARQITLIIVLVLLLTAFVWIQPFIFSLFS